MSIADNQVVTFHYTLRHGDELIETSAGKDPISYLHGHSNVIPGLEKAMEGKEAGAEFEVTVPMAEAYGERHEDRQQQVPVKHLQGAKRWKPGMVAMVQTDQGARQVTIIKAGLKHATVDLNHPLSGKDLTFNVEIVDTREATDDEIAHGHAHGLGGHQH
ncbi:FKBP-type peptidyl-prolyl cis-trans isomerase SlyD [Marinomonas spartinae]|uniref:Peptidyl-prolyl cis-trans isomerase n=1 Tax=Marinomonas spartinae TaxID=1792290 RepID=A0A1A8T7K3_9GAMM|nr:peptidylprolyl isomerase [Marinomonas spartinae]SBS27398.1 FKBP-type peptidyl-prolyl cis-trans isomerase SlyD [Marinomonas spartinae]SBS29752.1 FKBP-type peptidyl-prolyl cis-trans isomerase SlyD [Marinomonas spartinae]